MTTPTPADRLSRDLADLSKMSGGKVVRQEKSRIFGLGKKEKTYVQGAGTDKPVKMEKIANILKKDFEILKKMEKSDPGRAKELKDKFSKIAENFRNKEQGLGTDTDKQKSRYAIYEKIINLGKPSEKTDTKGRSDKTLGKPSRDERSSIEETRKFVTKNLQDIRHIGKKATPESVPIKITLQPPPKKDSSTKTTESSSDGFMGLVGKSDKDAQLESGEGSVKKIPFKTSHTSSSPPDKPLPKPPTETQPKIPIKMESPVKKEIKYKFPTAPKTPLQDLESTFKITGENIFDQKTDKTVKPKASEQNIKKTEVKAPQYKFPNISSSQEEETSSSWEAVPSEPESSEASSNIFIYGQVSAEKNTALLENLFIDPEGAQLVFKSLLPKDSEQNDKITNQIQENLNLIRGSIEKKIELSKENRDDYFLVLSHKWGQPPFKFSDGTFTNEVKRVLKDVKNLQSKIESSNKFAKGETLTFSQHPTIAQYRIIDKNLTLLASMRPGFISKDALDISDFSKDEKALISDLVQNGPLDKNTIKLDGNKIIQIGTISNELHIINKLKSEIEKNNKFANGAKLTFGENLTIAQYSNINKNLTVLASMRNLWQNELNISDFSEKDIERLITVVRDGQLDKNTIELEGNKIIKIGVQEVGTEGPKKEIQKNFSGEIMNELNTLNLPELRILNDYIANLRSEKKLTQNQTINPASVKTIISASRMNVPVNQLMTMASQDEETGKKDPNSLLITKISKK